MDQAFEPLFNDGMDGLPSKRVLQYVERKKAQGWPVAGIYCGYAPVELMQAMGIVPAVLCAFSKNPIATAEETLPTSLCPLIKSSFGFIQEGTCPFYNLSQVVIAETTCDGKKKMFELIADIKPTHVMDLPNLPDEPEALNRWTEMIRKLKGFLEKQLGCAATDGEIERLIAQTNEKNRLMRRIFTYAALEPPLISWQEIYDVCFLALPALPADVIPRLHELLTRLESRRNGAAPPARRRPRILVTGCPVGGDATKVFKLIEQAGGVVVALDACTGMKTFMGDIEEDSGDPIRALAARYLQIPCACMTPNTRRLTALSAMVEQFKPDAVIEVILQFCHTYNVESYKIGRHIGEAHGLPYMKIETNYGEGDLGQLKTRIEALMEMVR